jgi:hypothetical protein
MGSWTDAFKSFDAQTISSSAEVDGGILDFERVTDAFGVQWVVDNPNQDQMILQLYGSLDAVNFFNLGADVGILAGASLPAASLDALAVVQDRTARWVRATVFPVGGVISAVVATAIVTARSD